MESVTLPLSGRKIEFEKVVGIAIKSKETSSQLKLPMQQSRPVLATVNSNTCRHMHVQTKHSSTYLQDLIPTLAGVFAYIFCTSQSRN